MSVSDSSPSISPPLPRWLKRNVPKGGAGCFASTSRLIGELSLHTVCDHAKCPNRMECYAQKTATFMILGDVCTRACRFCSVTKGVPSPVDKDEPRHVAEAVARLGLEHAVITCVTRDDLPDGGAEHFAETIAEIRRHSGTSQGSTQRPTGANQSQPSGSSHWLAAPPTIEVLPSDFGGNRAAVERLVEACPNVYNHNTETVPRLYHAVRDRRTNYAWTLEMFRLIGRLNPAIALKTGLMLGLGETTDELLDTLAELREAGCRLLTLGQYLQPSPRQTPVVRYLPPDEFERLGELARRIGFDRVASGPFVRSSYHAREMARET